MGQVINSSAAADDIFADLETTYLQATARGGVWQSLAAQRLAPVRDVVASLHSRLATAQAAAAPLTAAVAAEDQRADRFIGQVADTIWNAIGRPAFDPTYDVVFPGGIAHYTDGVNESQPERMELLAELLDMKLISKLDPTLWNLTQPVRPYPSRNQKAASAGLDLLSNVVHPRKAGSHYRSEQRDSART